MKPTERLQALGQSLWLDNITRDLLDGGGLTRYIDEFSITGLTSNPSIFDKAIAGSDAYDGAIRAGRAAGLEGEDLFFALALDDLRRAAEMFRPLHAASGGVDGWVSIEVSPELAYASAPTLEAALRVHAAAARDNLFVKIPGTAEGLPAIEESIFRGVPVNVTLLFSRAQCLAAAEACLRGLERRRAAGLELRVGAVASVFISRWDGAVAASAPAELRNRLGIAVAQDTWQGWRELAASSRWQRLAQAGALLPRLLWASTSTKDPQASDTLYVEALAAPGTIDTIPEATLHAFAAHGRVETAMDPVADGQSVLRAFRARGVDLDALALKLQRDGAAAFVDSWRALLARLVDKARALAD